MFFLPFHQFFLWRSLHSCTIIAFGIIPDQVSIWDSRCIGLCWVIRSLIPSEWNLLALSSSWWLCATFLEIQWVTFLMKNETLIFLLWLMWWLYPVMNHALHHLVNLSLINNFWTFPHKETLQICLRVSYFTRTFWIFKFSNTGFFHGNQTFIK